MSSPSAKKRFFLPALVILFILSLNFFPNQTRGFFHFIFAPFESLLWSAGSLEKENNLLEFENLELKAELAKLQGAKEENETLREALTLTKTADFTFIVVPIVGKDPGADALVIQLPKDRKIATGMPVVTSNKVLAGRVSEVASSFAKVLLVSHSESSFDAKVSETNTVGLVRGQGRYRLLFDFVQKDAKLSLGDTVVTSSLGGAFPADLLVGTIGEIKVSDAQPFLQAAVTPFGNLQKEEFLLVITEF